MFQDENVQYLGIKVHDNEKPIAKKVDDTKQYVI